MKKFIVLTILGLFVLSLKAQTNFTIKGVISPTIKADIAVMSYPPDDKGGPYKADTTVIKDGKFEFKGTIGRPQLAELNLIVPSLKGSRDQSNEDGNNMKNVALFYLDGNIELSFNSSGMASYTGGGREEMAWLEYEKICEDRSKALNGVTPETNFFEELIADFVKSHPDNYVSVDLMDLFTQSSIQPNIVEPMYNALSKRMQNSEKVLGWVKKLEEAKVAVSGNQAAPEFTMNDNDGKPISLVSYRGSYVLLDFWASWCRPCRAENPNVLAAYEKYKDKNFQVISISLDDDKGSWLKAIAEDKLPWKQLCDFKADKSEVVQLYKIYSVPSNVLINPDGNIIGKDLRGKDLHDKLDKLFKPTQTKYNLEDFNLIVNVEDQEKYYNEMLQAAPSDNTKPVPQDEYLTTLATGWLAKGNLEKYRYYMKSNPEISFVSLLNLVYALEYLENDSKYMNIVEQASRDIICRIEKDASNDDLNRGRMQVLLEINALANAKLGNVDAAKKSIEKASAIKGDRETKYFRDSKANYYKRYCTVLSAAGEHKKALDTLANAVRNADSNPALLATLREVYIKVYGSDKGCDKFIGSLQEEAYKKCYKEVEKLYITDVNIPFKGSIPDPDGTGKQLTLFTAKHNAYNISLPDLSGKLVNFADYKGKILVVDFWSTLCTPCVSAFAGFKQVVAEYKKEPFQLFVIDLFEPQQTVKSFVAKKGITLDVLQDEPNETYDIQGTPTKIIFDPMGNIRFYSCGYAGSTDKEYYKLKAMVEIVKARTKSK